MIAIGSSGANLSTSTGGDTLIGRLAANNMTTSGGLNTIIGRGAGQFLTGGSGNTIIGSWPTPFAGVALNNVLGLAIGNALIFDYDYIKSNIFSFQQTTTATGLHVYNTLDSYDAPTNWERAVLSWRDTSNVFRLESQAAGTGTVRLIAIDAFQKAGAPAAGDLPSGTWTVINDTSGGNTWLVYNNSGTIRKVQLT